MTSPAPHSSPEAPPHWLRTAVRKVLEDTPSYQAMEPGKRRELAQAMVRVGQLAADCIAHAAHDFHVSEFDEHSAEKEQSDRFDQPGRPPRNRLGVSELADGQRRDGNPENVFDARPECRHQATQMVVVTLPGSTLDATLTESIECINSQRRRSDEQ